MSMQRDVGAKPFSGHARRLSGRRRGCPPARQAAARAGRGAYHGLGWPEDEWSAGADVVADQRSAADGFLRVEVGPTSGSCTLLIAGSPRCGSSARWLVLVERVLSLVGMAMTIRPRGSDENGRAVWKAELSRAGGIERMVSVAVDDGRLLRVESDRDDGSD